MQAREQEGRRDWVIILFILLFGLLCILLAGGWALRFAPSWELDAGMESNLDPNSEFLTLRPNGFIEPIDSSILTQPSWFDVFLTPGSSIPTRTPALITPSAIPVTRTANAVASATGTMIVTPTPTATLVFPNPTSTNTKGPTPTRTPIPAPSADLRITLTNGVTTYIVGGTTTYTIVVNNSGPSNVNGATVVDNFPPSLSGITWTCVSAGGATCAPNGNGNINAVVNLPVGSSVTYTVNASVSPATIGDLVNTATVTLPGSITDPVPANNTVTDTDTPVFNVDLRITKTDGVATYTVGGSVTYTIVVTNPVGPANATAATVTDTFPAQVSSVTWSCVTTGGASCTANGTGNINDSVNLPVGGSLTYTAIANIAPSATGILGNTASVTAPVGYNETAPVNNFATDNDAPVLNVDLQITKTDGVDTYTVGGSVTYTIVVTNPTGPANATAATITDVFPAQVSGVTWSCVTTGGASCAASGTGNINDTVNIPVGGSLTYTAIASISSSATGNLDNTATVFAPVGYNETALGNNSATDTDTPILSADLRITKTDNATDYLGGVLRIYSIVVSNAGPSDVTGATVTDTFPAEIASATWSCAEAGGAVCTANGSGNINDTVNMPAGSSVTYTVNATIVGSPLVDLENTASVNHPTDPNTGNNTATDTDALIVIVPTPLQIGTSPDGNTYNVTAGGTLTLNTNIVVNGHAGWDLVYYELPIGSTIWMDWVIVEIGDGQNWYTIFNWSNNVADTNTNVNFNLLPLPSIAPFPPPEEPDQREIPSASLYNSSGIAINLDGVVPAGTYSLIRFYSPPGDTDGKIEIDAIEILP